MSAAAVLESENPRAPRIPRPKAANRPRALSLRWIATLSAVLLSASAAVSVGFISERNARQLLLDEIQNRLVLQVRNLSAGSAGALLTTFPELTVQPLVKAMMLRQPELAFVVVRDDQDRIVGHPDARQIGQAFRAPEGLTPVISTNPMAVGESLRGNARLLVAEAPVLTPDRRALGSALVALDRTYVDQRLAVARQQQVLAIIVCLILSILVSFALMSRLLQPLTTLRRGIQRIGQGDLETPIQLHDRTELGTLAQTVNEMARDLRHAQATMLAQGRLEHEVDIARKIQRSLLPSESRRIGGAFLCGDQKSATEVGGDYYDILPLPDGRVAIAIADVAGKGLPGCLVMAMLSAVLRALRGAESSPSNLLARIDAQFAESLETGMFVTMFYGILDPETGHMVWASAGHNPMLVYRAALGTIERSESRGIPIGALSGGLIRRTLEDQTLRLEPGDVMVHCTDGYTEAIAPGTQELFGLDRLSEVVERNGAAGPQRVIDALIERVRTWTGGGALSDDETLLVVGWQPSQVRAAAAGGTDHGSAHGLEMLEAARRRGIGIEFRASLSAVTEVMNWVRGLPGFEDLPEEDGHLLGTGLLEVCANIAEHGLGQDPKKRFDLWWVPPENKETDRSEPAGRKTGQYAQSGCFVVRDDGRQFRPDNWTATDFTDSRARSRGRGFGLDIIHRVMRRADYFPGTSMGNITVLAFGPRHEDQPGKGSK